MATTSCPRCRADVPVAGDAGACPACGLSVRFEDAPEVPCRACQAPVVLRPDREWVPCPECGAPHATDPRRGVETRTRCPRCKRQLSVPWDMQAGTCPHCGAHYTLSNTL